MNNFIPSVNMFSQINQAKYFDTLNGPFKLDAISETPNTSFKDVLAGMVSNVNEEIQKPDELLTSHMNGNSDVDVHDVITAISKAELGVSLATQVTSKVVSAYNTVIQISV
ncbi:flagellar hook-basal body complex protein FliE [bacterium]|nr:flagellar hook-basal body complex protein FliE [bacterium]